MMLLLNALIQQFPNIWNVFTNKNLKTSFVEIRKNDLLTIIFEKNYRKIRIRSGIEQWLVNVEKTMFDLVKK